MSVNPGDFQEIPITREDVIHACVEMLEEAYTLFCDGVDHEFGSDEWVWDICFRYLREEIKEHLPEHAAQHNVKPTGAQSATPDLEKS